METSEITKSVLKKMEITCTFRIVLIETLRNHPNCKTGTDLMHTRVLQQSRGLGVERRQLCSQNIHERRP